MPETPDEELVRRLLADARHDEPIPADVAARLDAVLDDLADERRTAQPRRTVTSLSAAAASRRRRWATGLVAAAAVVVLGVATRGVWDTGGGGQSGGSSADSAGKGLSEAPTESRGSVELHRSTLRADVRRLQATLDGGAALGPSAPHGSSVCGSVDPGPGVAVPARLDGVPVTLVLRPPADGRQVADVLECGSTRALASVTLPAR